MDGRRPCSQARKVPRDHDHASGAIQDFLIPSGTNRQDQESNSWTLKWFFIPTLPTLPTLQVRDRFVCARLTLNGSLLPSYFKSLGGSDMDTCWKRLYHHRTIQLRCSFSLLNTILTVLALDSGSRLIGLTNVHCTFFFFCRLPRSSIL